MAMGRLLRFTGVAATGCLTSILANAARTLPTGKRCGECGYSSFLATPNSSSFLAMSSPWVSTFTLRSMCRILPSVPM